jgi:hypothetical protein
LAQPEPVRPSLFPGKERIEGSEIKFRAICALGWSLLQSFSELRSICDTLPTALDAQHWIDELEAAAIDKFTATDSETWPSSVSNAILFLKTKAEVKGFPDLVAFFQRLATQIGTSTALDPNAQLSEFNSRGFKLATQFINDPLWSSDLVSKRWNRTQAHSWQFSEDTVGNFQPVTAQHKDRIELRVNTGKFEVKNALLYYLTLEFQMMHEYISHHLPVWNSGNALEEEFLLAIMFLYYRESGGSNGLVSLVREADERRADSHRSTRQFIKDELAPPFEKKLAQILLELAVMDETEMPAAEKRHLLALLKRIPLQGDDRQKQIRGWINEGNVQVLYGRLKPTISVVVSTI